MSKPRNLVLPGNVIFHRRNVTPPVWEEIPMHPTIAAQTQAAYRISALQEYDGKLFVGYGNSTDNLGPVDLIAYDIETLEPLTVFETVMSECTDRFHVINGKFYAMWIDPKENIKTNYMGWVSDRTGVWLQEEWEVSMAHQIDLVWFKGAFLICGSSAADGVPPGYLPTCGRIVRGTPETGFEYVLQSEYTTSEYDPSPRFHWFDTETYPGMVRTQLNTTTIATGLTREEWISEDGIVWEQIPVGEPILGPATYARGSGMVNPDYRPFPNGMGNEGYPIPPLSYFKGEKWAWCGFNNGKIFRASIDF